MDTADNRVGLLDELVTGCRGNDRGVVKQPVGAGKPLPDYALSSAIK